jgi:hypothetical protein
VLKTEHATSTKNPHKTKKHPSKTQGRVHDNEQEKVIYRNINAGPAPPEYPGSAL